MSDYRKKAKTKKTIAIGLFAFAVINVLMKIIGVSKISGATTVAGLLGMKIGFYGLPIILIIAGLLYLSSSKKLLEDAEFHEKNSNQ